MITTNRESPELPTVFGILHPDSSSFSNPKNQAECRQIFGGVKLTTNSYPPNKASLIQEKGHFRTTGMPFFYAQNL
ncbi:MAG: hypothetical protein MR913_05720 [Clostridiales bacterium]|nr:hypothetical protein [Clostridiales bacterium]